MYLHWNCLNYRLGAGMTNRCILLTYRNTTHGGHIARSAASYIGGRDSNLKIYSCGFRNMSANPDKASALGPSRMHELVVTVICASPSSQSQFRHKRP